jgi:hypothetical protein
LYFIKGSENLRLEYQIWKPASLLGPPKTPGIISQNIGLSEVLTLRNNGGLAEGIRAWDGWKFDGGGFRLPVPHVRLSAL